MPGSKEVSTERPRPPVISDERLDELIGTTSIAYDPAIVSALLRSMANVELELFASGLTKHQQRLLGRIRTYRGIIWRMIPEGV